MEGSGTEGEDLHPPHPKPRPKPHRTRRQPSEAEGHMSDDEDVFGRVSSPRIPPPSERHIIQKSRLPVNKTPNDEAEVPHYEDTNREISQGSPHVIANGHHSPPLTSPLKRRRETQANEPEDSEEQENNDPSTDHPIPPPSPSHSHISVADMKSRRKRIRR